MDTKLTERNSDATYFAEFVHNWLRLVCDMLMGDDWMMLILAFVFFGIEMQLALTFHTVLHTAYMRDGNVD